MSVGDAEHSGHLSMRKTEENLDQVKDVSSAHFERQSENVSDCHQITALPAE